MKSFLICLLLATCVRMVLRDQENENWVATQRFGELLFAYITLRYDHMRRLMQPILCALFVRVLVISYIDLVLFYYKDSLQA